MKNSEDDVFQDSIDSSNTSTENVVDAGDPEVDQRNTQRSDQTRVLAIAQHVLENSSTTEIVATKSAPILRLCRCHAPPKKCIRYSTR